jgi:putative spermidine/putrescine transport system permease protein
MPPPSEAFLAAAAPRRRRSTTPARRRALGYALLILPVLLATLVLFVYPIGQILTTSVVDRGLTLANYRRALGDPIYLRVLWITVKISLLTTLVCLLLGYPWPT